MCLYIYICVSYSFIAKQETTSLLFHNVVPSWSQGHESSESTWSLFLFGPLVVGNIS